MSFYHRPLRRGKSHFPYGPGGGLTDPELRKSKDSVGSQEGNGWPWGGVSSASLEREWRGLAASMGCIRKKCIEESWAAGIKAFILVLAKNLMAKHGMNIRKTPSCPHMNHSGLG